MSRLLVVARPSIAVGFHLAGVQAYAAADIETAREIIEKWLREGEVGLLAIDDGLLDQMDSSYRKHLDAAPNLPYVAIPGGAGSGLATSRRQRIADAIRLAVGIHITFHQEEPEKDS
jgi:vacuolar-type H+-ATPase subunit F/Vma7